MISTALLPSDHLMWQAVDDYSAKLVVTDGDYTSIKMRFTEALSVSISIHIYRAAQAILFCRRVDIPL